ncbi:MAG TPA: DUF952 domain-containing protein [Anaerolineaceae bacterium]|nr:DUF952 domain-containing protein [Anaerolineaceae bacterium]HOG77075.1 DUF952 domain-containing protein [Anaerolineaceae bacterium]
MIYHITTSAEWENAKKIGGYTPQAFERDGFIHCSDLYQVEDVANHFYRDLSGLILLCIEPALTGIPLVYENLEGKAMQFPHLYGSPLPLNSVTAVIALLRDEKGDWRLPPALRRAKPPLMNELPFQLPGKLYRSVMPGSSMFDPQDEVVNLYQQAGIEVVVVLNPDFDIREYARQDLRERYEQAGLTQIHAPVADFTAPPSGTWNAALREVADLLRAGKKIAVHCHAGIGRTGMFCACLAQELLGLSPRESIDWVRGFIPGAVETEYQNQFVLDYPRYR